jgi:hypothetical protein
MKLDYDSRNWRDAKATIIWTPKQVYGDTLEEVLVGIKDSFLQIIAFDVPTAKDFFLTEFGHAQQDRGVKKPYFIIDVHGGPQGTTCPKCGATNRAVYWRVANACPECKDSIIRLRLYEWGNSIAEVKASL